jgi:ABC-2 type transport system ATP-binding protein
MTAALSLDRVTKRYGAVTAVSDLSFDVQPGEMFGLIGPDGAGKTSTIRLLCGLLHAEGGTVRVMGHDPVREHATITRDLGYLSQRFSLYGDLSIDENIAFFAEIHDLWQYDQRRHRLLELTNLLPFRSRLADRLSGGMKQKLALACTLNHEPRVILLDEPTTGVDPVSRREFWKLLAEFLEQGITILVSTPYLDEAERCHRVALLHEGRLLSLDTPDKLRRSLPGQMVEVIAEDQPRAVTLLSAHETVADVHVFGERIHVRLKPEVTQDGAALVRAALTAAGSAVRSTRVVPASLEDVFIAQLSGVRQDVATGP